MSFPAKPLKERLLNRIAISDTGCWLWVGYLDKYGYGSLGVPRCIAGKVKNVRAHRLSYELFKGPLLQGKYIDHLCKQRACINPDHLELVTPGENVMRSTKTFQAINAAKTHCKNGHPLSGQNLYLMRLGHRSCRTCRSTAYTKYYTAKRKPERQRLARLGQ